MIKSVCLVAALTLGGVLPVSAASLLAELVDAQWVDVCQELQTEAC